MARVLGILGTIISVLIVARLLFGLGEWGVEMLTGENQEQQSQSLASTPTPFPTRRPLPTLAPYPTPKPTLVLYFTPKPTLSTVSIGRWVDESAFVGSKIAIFKQGSRLYLEMQFLGDSPFKREVVESRSPHVSTLRPGNSQYQRILDNRLARRPPNLGERFRLGHCRPKNQITVSPPSIPYQPG